MKNFADVFKGFGFSLRDHNPFRAENYQDISSLLKESFSYHVVLYYRGGNSSELRTVLLEEIWWD